MDVVLPKQPPIELIQEGRVWVVSEFWEDREGTTFSTHETQMEAVRAAKSKMERDTHPCVLRWESVDNVQNVYWNPLFERLDVAYDELIDAWTVVPAKGTCAIETTQSREEAVTLGKESQREYDFKHLRLYSEADNEYRTRDHRFLRYNITDSGVRFDRETLKDRATEQEAETTSTESTEIVQTGPATPGRLGVSVPDVTQVEFVDTDGVLNRYETPWGDGTTAQIVAVSQKYANHESVRDAFVGHLDPWRGADDDQNVATVHESGTDPTPWVAYRSGDHALSEIGFELPINERLQVLRGIASACSALDEDCCGIRPENVRLRDEHGWQVTVANWGTEWAVNTALSSTHVTPFTAPEQLGGQTSFKTPVYQFAAVAYWLLCERPPVEGESIVDQIQAGQIDPPTTISAVPAAVESVLERGLSTDPVERPGSVHQLVHRLLQPIR